MPVPVNEPVKTYAPGSRERAEIEAELARVGAAEPAELTGTFGAERRPGTGADRYEVRMPSDHSTVLGVVQQASHADAKQAVEAAMAVAGDWSALPFDQRAAVFLRAADLIAGPYRARINAATMLGQAKTVQQAEIDSACELIDFLRFNAHFAQEIYANQPLSSAGVWNRMDYRPLEGFVYAITPFNFTAIAGNLPTSAALMGNPVLWKPALSQMFAAEVIVDVLRDAGLPDGVINLVPGHGREVSDVALAHPDLAGIHFTGSTRVFQGLWGQVGANIAGYRSYPRIVGETGGKDFVVAHPSADPEVLKTALIRGAFEYSGQKCSAASRAYLPKSLWNAVKDDLIAQTEALSVGDVRDFSHFTSAVIDERAFVKLSGAIDAARDSSDAEIVAGGSYDRDRGLVHQAHPDHVRQPQAGHLRHGILRPDPGHLRLRRRRLRVGSGRRRHRVRVRLDGGDPGHRPFGGGTGDEPAAVHRRQLLHQRQADRGGRRPTAVRRGTGVRHQ